MKSGAVHIGSCQTKMTLNSENKYSAEFDSIKWSDCGIHPQQSGQELYFEAEVTPDPPTVTAHNGILITKSLTKVGFKFSTWYYILVVHYQMLLPHNNYLGREYRSQ